MPRLRWNRTRLVVAAVIGCLVPLVAMSPGGAAPAPVATSIRVVSVLTQNLTVPTSPDTPTIWVAANTPFDVTASGIDDATGLEAPLSSNKDTRVDVTAVTPNGTVSLGSVTFPAGVSTITFTRTLDAGIDNAYLHLESVERRTDPVRSGDSATFDVQRSFTYTSGLDVAIGGTVTGASCQPTTQSKICYRVSIPAGALTGDHLVSVGNCTNSDANNLCTTQYWWSIASVNATRTNPAVTEMGLDKSLKGVAFANGVPTVRWVVRPSGEEVWVDAPSCPSKGVVGADQEFCQDTSASRRDNSGDTWIRLLWLRDLRGSTK
ncbi:MAG TPA: hypothetical protein VFK41_05135 [Nocardioidaceae bacterium]|nr:hypothetical protein [Nocardioidaceae bacterium]